MATLEEELRKELETLSATPLSTEMEGGDFESALERELRELGQESEGVDPDVPVGISAPEQPEPEDLEADIVITGKTTRTAVPSTLEDLYYSGDIGKEMQAKETAARETLRMQGVPSEAGGQLDLGILGEYEFSNTVVGPTPEEIAQAKADLSEVVDYKREIFEGITGDNVTDLGVAGKIITSPDGTRRYIPGPYSSNVTQTIVKSVSDTLRGILALPEAVTGGETKQAIESLQIPELVPAVNSDNPYVNTISEVIQLGAGGLGGLSLAGKAERYAQYASDLPRVRAFFKGAAEEFDYLADPRLSAVAKGITDTVKTTAGGILPKGTVSTALGAAVVADEDVATFFGDPDMTVGEVKMQVLKESLLFGVVFNAAAGIGEITQLTPALRFTGQKMAGAVSALFASASPNTADQRAIEILAERLFESSKRLSDPANTPEDIARIHLENWEEVQNTYRQISGGKELQDVIDGIEAPMEGGPTLSELVGDTALIRLEQSLRTNTSSTETAGQILRNALSEQDYQRMEAITEAAQEISRTVAPRQRKAGQEVAETLRPEMQAEVQALEQTAGRETAETVAQTEAALEAAEQQTRATIGAAEAKQVEAEAIRIQTAETVKETLEQSKVSVTNLDDLNNIIDEDGALEVISDVLRRDLDTKKALGQAKDSALQSIRISGEEAQGLVDEILQTYTNPNFLVGDDAVQNSAKELRQLITTFRSTTDEVVPTTPGATPTTPPTIGQNDLRLQELMTELQSVSDATRYLEIAREVDDLVKRGAKLPPQVSTQATPPPQVLSEGAEEAVEELPDITALDLEDIIIATQQRIRRIGEAQLETGSRQLARVNEGLRSYVARLDEQLAGYVDADPAAKEARDNFRVFFDDFKERWRSETGKEWQGTIIGSKTRVDIAGAEDKIMKIMTNPQASKADRQIITEIVSQMPEEVRDEFVGSVGTRLVADFARTKGVLPDDVAEITLKQATTALNRLNVYLNKNSSFENALPDAFAQLRQIRDDLERVVSPAEEAQQTAREVAQATKETVKTAEAELTKKTRELNRAEKESLASIQKRLNESLKEVEKSAVAKLLNVDDPTQYVTSLFTKADGFKQYKEIWDRAGQIGEALPSGLTPTQEALQETLTFALMKRVYPTRREALSELPDALSELSTIIRDPDTTPGKMFQLAFEKNPDGLKMLENFEKSVTAYLTKRNVASRGAQGSATFEKQYLSKMVDDVFMVMYGPLTQDFRFARFMNRIFFNAFDGDVGMASAFVRVLTDERYTKLVLDKAAEIAKNKAVPEEEGFRAAFGAALMAAAGTKKYLQSPDPDEAMLEDARQYAIAVETEEGLGGQPSPE